MSSDGASWVKPARLVTDDEADEIRSAILARRLTLPALMKDWLAKLLADRDERVRRQRTEKSPTE